MGRKIESFEDWYRGIAFGKLQAYEKYTIYVFQNKLNQQLERLKSINDSKLVDSLFDSMMEETELPVSEIERVIAMINHCHEEQVQLEKKITNNSLH